MRFLRMPSLPGRGRLLLSQRGFLQSTLLPKEPRFELGARVRNGFHLRSSFIARHGTSSIAGDR